MPQSPRFTYDEYYRMADAGIFGNRRVELITGETVEMAPQDEPHAVGILLLDAELQRAFGRGYVIRQRLPLRTGVDEEPEPDIAVVTGNIRDTLTSGRPRSASLVVEVSLTTV